MDSSLSRSQFNGPLDNFLTLKKKENSIIISSVENMEQHEFYALLGGMNSDRDQCHCLLKPKVLVTCDPLQSSCVSSMRPS